MYRLYLTMHVRRLCPQQDSRCQQRSTMRRHGAKLRRGSCSKTCNRRATITHWGAIPPSPAPSPATKPSPLHESLCEVVTEAEITAAYLGELVEYEGLMKKRNLLREIVEKINRIVPQRGSKRIANHNSVPKTDRTRAPTLD